MPGTFRAIVLCVLIFGLSGPLRGEDTTQPAGDAPPLLPDVSSIQTQMDHEDYVGASVRLNQILKLTGSDATAYNHHQVVMMLVECRLHQKQLTEALALLRFEKGDSQLKNNWTARAEAYSLYELLFESPALVYTPAEGTDQNPLNLLDLDQRKLAYDDLFKVKLAAFIDKLHDAADLGDLTVVSNAADDFLLVRCLEQVSKSTTKQTGKIGSKLAAWANNYINLTLKSYNSRVTDIEGVSNLNTRGRKDPKKPAGLTPDERRELIDLRDKSSEIKGVVAKINQSLGNPITIQLPKMSLMRPTWSPASTHC